MVHFFCPSCWSEVAEGTRLCPRCGVDVDAFWKEGDYVEHLILALQHPEPQTPMRAAWILGKLREQRAVAPLARLARHTRDVYLARAAAEALARIGGTSALDHLRSLARHPARMVREAVKAALTAQAAVCDMSDASDPKENASEPQN